MRWGLERVHREWQQVSGLGWWGATKEKAPPQPHHLHYLPAPWAWASLREVPLPWRLQPRGAGHESQPPWSSSAGVFQSLCDIKSIGFQRRSYRVDKTRYIILWIWYAGSYHEMLNHKLAETSSLKLLNQQVHISWPLQKITILFCKTTLFKQLQQKDQVVLISIRANLSWSYQ